MSSDIFPLGVLCVFLAAVFVLPPLVLLVGLQRFRRSGSYVAGVAAVLGGIVCVMSLLGVGTVVELIGQNQVLAEGLSPEGREYCVIQSRKRLCLFDNRVSFYVRDPEGVWRRAYLAHEDMGWRSVKVEFEDGVARVFQDGMHERDIELPKQPIDHSPELRGYLDDYFPAHYSVKDLADWHYKRA